MTDQNYSPKEKCSQVLQYSHLPWGELIYGTKQQLKSLGLGIGLSFPNADRKGIKFSDPRGFPTTIYLSEYMGAGIYSASIHFPERDKPHEPTWKPYARGVEWKKWNHSDEYKGDASSLIAAGLVDPDCFPGEPEMGKVQVTLNAEGKRCRLNGLRIKDRVGCTTIKKISRKSYMVSVIMPENIAENRLAEYRRKDDEWEVEMRLLPRPQSLVAMPKQELTKFILSFAKEDEKFQMILESIKNMDPNES